MPKRKTSKLFSGRCRAPKMKGGKISAVQQQIHLILHVRTTPKIRAFLGILRPGDVHTYIHETFGKPEILNTCLQHTCTLNNRVSSQPKDGTGGR